MLIYLKLLSFIVNKNSYELQEFKGVLRLGVTSHRSNEYQVSTVYVSLLAYSWGVVSLSPDFLPSPNYQDYWPKSSKCMIFL